MRRLQVTLDRRTDTYNLIPLMLLLRGNSSIHLSIRLYGILEAHPSIYSLPHLLICCYLGFHQTEHFIYPLEWNNDDAVEVRYDQVPWVHGRSGRGEVQRLMDSDYFENSVGGGGTYVASEHLVKDRVSLMALRRGRKAKVDGVYHA
jgi:hypothetical protein